MRRLAVLACLAALTAPFAFAAAPTFAAPSPGETGCAPPLLAERPAGPRSGAVPTFINVEIDYMVERNSRGTVLHSHRPTAAEVAAVVGMFACQGIILTVEVDDEIEHVFRLKRDPDNPNNFFDYTDFYPETSFEGIKDAHVDHAVGSGWHYAVFGHRYQDDEYKLSGSSGLGEVGGDDFLVTLGAFRDSVGTAWDRASTFAHELGHNLGLRHAGAMNSEAVGNYAPNVTSIMSYFHQLTGIRTAFRCNGLISGESDETGLKELDYSHGRACSLNEIALDEARGMGIVAADWDCNGSIGGVKSVRIGSRRDGWCGAGTGVYLLADYNEWANIDDNTSIFGGAQRMETVECVTAEEIVAFRAVLDANVARIAARTAESPLEPDADPDAPTADPLAPLASLVPLDHCPQATLATEACDRRGMRYIATAGSVGSGLSCRSPILGVALGVSTANAGDVLYIAPGTYMGGLTITKQVKLLGPGGVEIGGQ